VPDADDGPAGTGRVTHGDQLAWIVTPPSIEPGRAYPLVIVLHGAGRQDELIVRGLQTERERREAIFVVPRSLAPTWDIITGGDGVDLAFLTASSSRSTGAASTRLARRSSATRTVRATGSRSGSNPRIFSAVMAWAAGFLAIDGQNLRPDDPKPHVFLEYGSHDQLFPFEQVALPMREALTRMGYPLEFRVDEGGIHWPRPGFLPDALDWFLGLPLS
jgi:hypothetical protein